jgi:putative nucleotidyltransferase with HDIG domain
MLLLMAWNTELYLHSKQVACAMKHLAPPGEEEMWYWAGFLHDTGKIAVPPGILDKRGVLDSTERILVQRHPAQGAVILKVIGAPLVVVEGAQFHHERWDGRGYPYNLSGLRVPEVARALAVADVYAALTSDRPYRQAYTPAQARQEVERNAGTQFEPEMVRRFVQERIYDSR